MRLDPRVCTDSVCHRPADRAWGSNRHEGPMGIDPHRRDEPSGPARAVPCAAHGRARHRGMRRGYARLGDVETLARLCESDPTVAALDSVMVAAVDFSHHALVSWLLERGANVNARAEWGSRHTALHSAAWNGDLKMVTLLVEAGADRNDARRRARRHAAWLGRDGDHGHQQPRLQGSRRVSAELADWLTYSVIGI